MTDTIVPFPPKPEEHLTGDAVCSACNHRWAAVAPVGTTALECPRCHRSFGEFTHPVSPPDGAYLWICGCGHTTFVLTPSGARCRSCGVMQNPLYNS